MITPIQLKNRLLTQQGRRRWVRHRTPAVLDAAGQPQYLHGRLIEMTDLKRVKADLAAAHVKLRKLLIQARRLADDAKAADRAKRAFLSCVSHELRTPLTSVLCGLSMVLDGIVDSPAQERELIALAHASGQRLLGIINDVLDMSALEAGMMKAYPQPILVCPVLDEVSSLVRPLAEKKGILLEWQVADPARRVQADPNLLQQILVYLVVNAVKFTEVGRVTLRACVDGDRMALTVADTGIGIARDVQATLFQPFVQGDSSSTRRYGGIGLGLSLSRRL